MSKPNITIVGRIGTDPEFKNFGGNNIVKFRVITSDRRKTDDGKWEDVNTSGWNIVGWNKLAESSQNILEKGQEVIVIGSMKEDSWTDKDGNNRNRDIKNLIALCLKCHYELHKKERGKMKKQEDFVGCENMLFCDFFGENGDN
jgi:single-strand DNA-binding protein